MGNCILIPVDFMQAIDAAVTALIPNYVNHLDNGGNWQGQTTCAPAWTEANILAAIGATSRITVGSLGTPLSAAWARQVYALLGMMGWVRKIIAAYERQIRDLVLEPTGGVESDASIWARAQILWPSTSWINYSSAELSEAWTARGSLWDNLNLRRIRGNYTIPGSVILCNCDMYVYPTIWDGGTWINNGDWNDSDANKYFLFQTVNSVTTATPSNYIGNNNTIPDYIFGRSFFMGWYILSPITVQKFNIPGGFLFQ